MKRKKPWARKWDTKPLRAPKLVRLAKNGSPLALALRIAFSPARTRLERYRRRAARETLEFSRR